LCVCPGRREQATAGSHCNKKDIFKFSHEPSSHAAAA
jgi:hypothetical protein